MNISLLIQEKLLNDKDFRLNTALALKCFRKKHSELAKGVVII
jgi:hypothetical protein